MDIHKEYVMSYTTDNLIKVLKDGGSISLGFKGRTTDNLCRLAEAARNGGGSLTVRIVATEMTSDNMARVAATAPGRVTFVVE